MFGYSSPLVVIHVNKLLNKKKLWLNFNLCLSGYFKCSIITWDSTNMLKRISSSPVFFYNPPTSFTNNVLRIDRSHYFSPFESNAAGTFSRIPRNHFFDFVALPAKLHWEKITRMTINTNSRAIVFRALLLSHVFKNWREQIRTRGAGACQRLLSTYRNYTGAFAAKCPSAAVGGNPMTLFRVLSQ